MAGVTALFTVFAWALHPPAGQTVAAEAASLQALRACDVALIPVLPSSSAAVSGAATA